jgi:hypothetical protein
MTVVALASVKHAPGVTTAAVALAAVWHGDAVVVEADSSGGDIAARVRLPLDPGLLTLAAGGRRPGARLELSRHAQALPAGGSVVVAPVAPDLTANAVATVASRLPAALEGRHGLIDCGRLSSGSPCLHAVRGADLLIVLAEPTVTAVEHLRSRLDFLRAATPRLAVVLVGDRPYGPTEVSEALDVPVVGAVAVDPRGVAALYAGQRAHRSLLVRSVRSVLDHVANIINQRQGVA